MIKLFIGRECRGTKRKLPGFCFVSSLDGEHGYGRRGDEGAAMIRPFITANRRRPCYVKSAPSGSRDMTFYLLSATKFDPFLETLEWNNLDGCPSPYLLLPLHLARLRDAALRHNWNHAFDSISLLKLTSLCQSAVYNCCPDSLGACKACLLGTIFPLFFTP